MTAILSLALGAASSHAQEPERVKIDTVDGVSLRGQFYAGKRNAPVVILLHSLDGDSRSKDWTNLALALQKCKGNFAVLSFDFRGHGSSTEVDPAIFWKYPPNQSGIKNYRPNRDSIEAKDFKPEYRSMLINDIAAVKAYLDRKNDTGACNTGSTILIGAQEGATLGSIWLNSEWHRYRMVVNMFMGVMQLNAQPEGRDVCAGIWLTPSPKLGNSLVSLHRTGFKAAKAEETPMLFMYGALDPDGKKMANSLEKYLKDTKALKEKLKFTGPYEIPGTKLTGAGLLKSPDTTKNITKWLEEVVVYKGQEWVERDFRKTQYFWKNGGRLMPAKVNNPSEMNMSFDTYMSYIHR